MPNSHDNTTSLVVYGVQVFNDSVRDAEITNFPTLAIGLIVKCCSVGHVDLILDLTIPIPVVGDIINGLRLNAEMLGREVALTHAIDQSQSFMAEMRRKHPEGGNYEL